MHQSFLEQNVHFASPSFCPVQRLSCSSVHIPPDAPAIHSAIKLTGACTKCVYCGLRKATGLPLRGRQSSDSP